jgi:PTH1 family peptidyl-tRNA hydrolase
MRETRMPHLIVGLGNPGPEYEWSRHNLGFMLVDKLAEEARTEIKRRECSSLVGRAMIDDCEVQLIKPQTYMNLSGQAVSCLVKKYETPIAERLTPFTQFLAMV